MRRSVNILAVWILLILLGLSCSPPSGAQQSKNESLRSWNDGPAKQAIVEFVAKVTTQGSPNFVSVAERIATFDNDGTLWCEQPIYMQMAFVVDRVHALVAKNPEWKNKQPFKAVLEKHFKNLAAQGEKGAMQLVAATHAGMSSEEFNRIATDWIANARHPKFKRPFTEMVYQPMLEVLAYLRANGFKTFIVSGGGVDFMRAWTEKVYGRFAGQQPKPLHSCSRFFRGEPYGHIDGVPV